MRMLLAAIAVFAALVWFRYCPVPFLGAAVISAVLCFAMAAHTRREWLQIGLIAIGTVGVTFAIAESYWWIRSNSGPPPATYPSSYLIPNPMLGYVPRPGAVAHIRRTDRHARVLYDATYTIDSLGLRTSPPTVVPAPDSCIVFFGDSFTFGEGLPDSAAMPYRVGVRTGGKYQIRNFGLHGYGPHQMLAALEGGFVTRRLHCKPVRVIYQAIPAHVARASGRARGVRGPRYELDANGRPVRRGNLDDQESVALTWQGYLRAQLDKSALVALIGSRTRPQDLALFSALVRRSREVSDSLFPGSEFHVILWSNPGDPGFVERVRSLGVRVHLVRDIIPNLTSQRSAYEIAGDGHPNARAQDAIAAYVASAIVRAGTGAATRR